MDGWNTTFLLGRPIFGGYVSFREGISIKSTTMCSFFFYLSCPSRSDLSFGINSLKKVFWGCVFCPEVLMGGYEVGPPGPIALNGGITNSYVRRVKEPQANQFICRPFRGVNNYKAGPLAVINGVITSINGLIHG